jgi:pSer/pThr/pTyr-binding forkhead associated (FHA) protein
MGVRLHVRSLWTSTSEDEVVYEFDQDRILLGRGRGADVCLPHRAVSLRHASIELSGARYTLVDHGSTNGTRVSNARLVPGRPKPLRDGDRIEIGGFALVFRSGVAVAAPTSSERTASLARRLVREVMLEEPEQTVRPAVVVLNGPAEGIRIVLPEPPARLLVGRAEHCELTLPDADASREHAELEVTVEGVRLRDLGSKNGVVLGGRAVRERLLDDRDELQIGSTLLSFEDPAGARVRELENGDDEAVEPPTWTEPEPPEPERAPDEEPAPTSDEPLAAQVDLALPRPKPPSIAAGDMVIYVLASVVFAVSVLGLFWLMRG